MSTIFSLEIIFIGVGLAMDAFAVSITSGIVIKNMRLRHAMRIALFFGGFQALMPILGWLGGTTFSGYIKQYDHWVAFVVLVFIGGRMIYESFKLQEVEKSFDPRNLSVLFVLAVATSIDALAVGVTFSFLDVRIWHAAGVIGVITFVISYAGTRIGQRFGHFLENKIEVLGGVILIGIGTKILIEHLFFGG